MKDLNPETDYGTMCPREKGKKMESLIICAAIYFFVGHIYLSHYYWDYGYGTWWDCDSKERIVICIHHIIWPVKLFFK